MVPLSALLSCVHPAPSGPAEAPAEPSSGSPAADRVFRNGVLYTLAPLDAALRDTRTDALAVLDGEIVAVGEGARAWIGPETEVIDLLGRTVLPGFTDAHTHLLWSGADLLTVNLYSARSVSAIADRVLAWAEAHPEEAWVQGGGWDTSTFLEVLDRRVIDGILSDRPTYLYSADAHIAVANSLALSLAGISAGTPDPPDGIIGRDPSGEPDGILLEGAMELVADRIPPYDRSTVDRGLENAQAEANSFGITNVVDACVEDWMLEGYVRADREGRLTVRVHGAVEIGPLDPDPAAMIAELRDRYRSPRVEVNAAKLFLDGIIESGTAYMLEPYADGTDGAQAFADDRLRQVAILLDASGFQLHAHVIGDGAARQFLDAVEAVERANGPRDRRPLAAHLEVIDPEDLPRFASLGVLADFQALWAWPDSYIRELTWPAIGEERSQWLYPIGAVHRAGGEVVGGSDWSVSSQNPLEAIEVAVTRTNPWRDRGRSLTPQHAMDLDAAIRTYTSSGARASFSEDRIGTLEIGKRADLVVLDTDPFSVAPRELSRIRVDETWLDGERVFSREQVAARRIRRAPVPR